MTPRSRPGTPRLLRALNDRAALELLLADGPLTRAQLGERTGLSKVTASQMVERLERRGLVERVGVQAGGRGPNAQLYAVVAGCARVVGVEVGPHRVSAATADITGAVSGVVELDASGSDDPIGVVHAAVTSAARQADLKLDDIQRVVLGTPGVVDPATGDMKFSWELPRWHRGLIAALRGDLERPVTIENDVNLATVTESRLGAAQGVDDFALFWVSRGLGLGVVLGGRLHRGATGGAGEVGYLPVPGGPVPHAVTSGVKPSFSRIATADVLRAVARRYGFRAASAAVAVRDAVEAGERGQELLAEVARRLALGLAASCVVLDPALVVLAGDVGIAGGPPLAALVAAEVATIAPVSPRVVVSAVPERPVLHGALLTGVDAAREGMFEASDAMPVAGDGST